MELTLFWSVGHTSSKFAFLRILPRYAVIQSPVADTFFPYYILMHDKIIFLCVAMCHPQASLLIWFGEEGEEGYVSYVGRLGCVLSGMLFLLAPPRHFIHYRGSRMGMIKRKTK